MLAKKSDVAARRLRACKALMAQVHSITSDEGINPSTLHAIKLKLVALAKSKELFPAADFAMPVAQGRNYPLLVEDGDGLGFYLNVALPGKEAAPHDHGIWCATAAVSGREKHEFYRRTDDGKEPGSASVRKVGEVLVQPGHGMVMADHDIHATTVVGDKPMVALSLYGYALARFPSVAWYHPQFQSVRATASRRPSHSPGA
jgi:predicted metal-dependent enzyme (double-stranded beta helix superfamily)